MSKSPANYRSIQQLRAAAALSVVFFHVGIQAQSLGLATTWSGTLSAGVDVFFVISGFVMWATTAERPKTPLAFMRDRLTRIVPLYWALTSITLAILLVAPRLLQSSRFDLPHVMGSYLFVPVVHPVHGIFEPLIFAGWTLNYEMAFYAIFTCGLLLAPAARLVAVLAVLALLTLLSFVDMPRTAIASFYFTDLFAEFGFGMIIAALVVKGRRASSWLAGSAVLVGLLAFVGSGTVLPTDLPHALMYGLPAALIVFGAVNLEVNGIVLPAHWVDRLGDASYSLYLVHEMVLSAGRQGWSRFMPAPLADNLWLFVFACVIALCAAGLLCWRYLEMPLTRFARACFAPPARVRPALAAE